MERGAAIDPVWSVRSFQRALAVPDALRWHAALFAGGAVALTLLNVLRSPDRLWFWAPLLVWATLLALHAWCVARMPFATAVAPTPAAAASHETGVAASATAPPALALTPPDPAPAVAPTPSHSLPAAAELAALRLSLDPWATAALVSADVRPEELPESVLALWRLTPEPPPAPAAETPPPPRSAVDLQTLGWI
jgi:2TM domain-containing protein